MRRALLAALLAGCGDLAGFSGELPPLATFTVVTRGDFEAVRVPGPAAPDLHVALVWGAQWLPEPTCFLPPETPELAAVIAAGCRNSLAFTPAAVGGDAALVPGVPVELPLFNLPSADLMVGDVTARVAYASLVIYDDLDHDGVLRLPRSRPQEVEGGGGSGGPEMFERSSIIYGASFVAMTEPDTRLAFREGAFIETGFYPRHGCAAPPPAFSVLASGGFTLEQAIAATAAGELPAVDPATCSEAAPDAATVAIRFRAPAEVGEVTCVQRSEDSSVRYRKPAEMAPDLDERPHACVPIPSLGGPPTGPPGTIQLVLAGRPDEPCRTLTHLTLIGCDESSTLDCDTPEWDLRASPPDWWPCPVEAQVAP